MRTTCVATMLEAGHAINALPQSAKAFVNCRILPGNTNEQIVKEVNEMLNDNQIVIKVIGHPAANPPSPSDPELMKTVEQVTKKIWPGVPVIAVLDVGASDGIYLRSAGIPTYGISGVFVDEDDNRAHGRDERIGVKEFYEGVEYEYALIRAFSSGNK
jgi:acetylornithine deacetylase/succinyl-diaminopimelate desuccinylase-like protein